MKLLCLSLLLVSSIQSCEMFSRLFCCSRNKTIIIDTIQDSESEAYLEELLEAGLERKKRSCCKSTCAKIIIGGIAISALAVPAIINLVSFINDIKNKAELVEQSCIKMDNHCSNFDVQCHILGSQVQLLIELLSKITNISQPQVICILQCTKNYTTIIEQLACVSGCFKV